ncbi:MAG TPA: hypothetical protein VJR89_32315 [Polyangiales bacterium]|nr:hypothetical protein [Polyangiales bacterium]
MGTELDAVLDRYLDALLAHDAARLPVASALKITENGYPIQLGHGLFETAREITYRHAIEDPASEQIAMFGAVREGLVHANFWLRLKVERGAISEIETIIARPGTASLVRPELLAEPKPIYAEELPSAARASRAELIATANRYFQAIEHNTADVPFHPSCNRTANGQQTTNSGPVPLSCLAQFEKKIFSYITRVRERRFLLIDPAKGLVCGTFLMDVPGRKEDFASFPIPFEKLPAHMYTPHTILLAELFKIVHGQIREIEATMVNVPLGATCGWPA